MGRAVLEYYNVAASAWSSTTTEGGDNAIISISIRDILGNPTKAKVSLNNRPKDFGHSSDTSLNRGKLTNVFEATDFIRVRIKDDETNIIMFYGRVYKSISRYDPLYGSVMELECFDALKELNDAKTDAEEDIGITTSLKKSDTIKTLIDRHTNSNNISYSDTTRFEGSLANWTANGGDKFLTGQADNTALEQIMALAKIDSWTSSATDEDRGFDFFVDPNHSSHAGGAVFASMFNYFKRTSRPPTAGQLTFRHPTGTDVRDTGSIKLMQPEFDFDKPQDDRYTEVIAKYQSTGESSPTYNPNGTGKGITRFERIAVTNIAPGTKAGLGTSETFLWNGLAFYENTAMREIAIGGGETAIEGGYIEESTNPDSRTTLGWAESLNVVDSSGNVLSGKSRVATVQFQSATTGAGYLLISDIASNFPTGTSSVILAGNASGATCTFVPRTGRMLEVFGIKKAARLPITWSTSPNTIREEAVQFLSQSTDQIVKAKFRTLRYPYFYKDGTISSVSGNAVTISFNPQSCGFLEGMVIAKMSSAGSNTQTAHGYATDVTATTITAIIDTGSWAANDNIRIYVPYRAGYVGTVTNNLTNINGPGLVTEIEYVENPGARGAYIQTLGKNDSTGAGGGIGHVPVPVRQVVKDAQEPTGDPIKFGAFGGWEFTGTFTATDYNTISWSAGVFTFEGSQNTYNIVAGSADVTTAIHRMYFRPTVYTEVTVANVVSRTYTFQVVLESAYAKKPEDSKAIMWLKANTDSVGPVLYSFNGSHFANPGLFNPADIVPNNSITNALSKKGAQPFSSDIKFRPYPNSTSPEWDAFQWDAGNLSLGESTSSSNDQAISAGNYQNMAANSTYYAYATIGSATLSVSTNFRAAFSDDTILLCTVTTAASDPGVDTAPTILPFNSKSPTLSAVSIAANAITADAIQAGSIDTSKLTVGSRMFRLTDASGNDYAASKKGTIASTANPFYPKNLTSLASIPAEAETDVEWEAHRFYYEKSDGSEIYNTIAAGSSNHGGSLADMWVYVIPSDTNGASATYVPTLNFTASGTNPAIGDNKKIVAYVTKTDGANSAANERIPVGVQILNFAPKTTITDAGIRTNSIISDLITGGQIIGKDFRTNANVGDGGGPAGVKIHSGGVYGYSGGTTKQFWIDAVKGIGNFGGVSSNGYGKITLGLLSGGGTGDGITFAADALTTASIAWADSDTTRYQWLYKNTTFGNNQLWFITNRPSNALDPVADAIVFPKRDLGISLFPINKIWTDGIGGGGISDTSGTATVDSSKAASRKALYDHEQTTHGGGGSGDIEGVNTTSPITGGGSSGTVTIAHSSSAGSKHIPTGGSGGSGSRQVLTYSGSSGTATWQNASAHGSHGGGVSGSGSSSRFAYWSNSSTLGYNSSSLYLDVWVNDIKFGGTLPYCGDQYYPAKQVYTNDLFATSATVKFTGLSTSTSSTSYLKIKYTGSSIGQLIQDSSSRDVKENIVDLLIDTTKIYDLVPRSFKFKDTQVEVVNQETKDITYETEIGEDSFGMIAEEVYEIMPELVMLRDGKPIALDYPLISVLLLAELKTLKARIEVLEGN